MFRLVGAAILDLIYPRYCVGCERYGSVLCRDCTCDIDYCYLPVRIKLDPLFIDDYLVAARLEGTVRTIVHQLKYNGVKELAALAGELIFLSTEWPDADMVTSVPLHKRRLGERGFNQAALIGKSFCQHSGLPYCETLLRTKNTPHQAQQASRAERARNISDYFSLIPHNGSPTWLRDKSIIIIDDVCTTGTTLNHCAKVLKEAGCKTVTALTLAHGR